VIRKLNVNANEFIPESAINITNAEFITGRLNINAEEFIPQSDNMNILVNSMLRDLIN
jgi:hypothetical protein